MISVVVTDSDAANVSVLIAVVRSSGWMIDVARAQHDRAGRARAVEIFDSLIAWMNDNGQQIEST